jgi:hypothetical protein
MIPIILLFILWFFYYGKVCSCEKPNRICYRTEFYGFQYGHLMLSILVGFLYPKQLKLWMFLGVLWEIFEYWLSQRPDIICAHGGCLAHYKGKDEGPLWMRKVYGGKPKYENFIDRMFGIKNSTEHTWHYSVGENVTNLVGFLIGSALTKR